MRPAQALQYFAPLAALPRRSRRRPPQTRCVLPLSRSRHLFDLTELEFDRRRAAEDRDRDLEPRALLIDLLDMPGERRKRSVGHPDLLPDLERDGGLRPLHALPH